MWQKAGRFDCKTCEDQIKKFSQQVGWNLGEQIKALPGDYVGQYPTVATLGWQRYVDSDRSLFNQAIFGKGTWQNWRIEGFNFFDTLKKCQGQTPGAR
ncbi:MAG: hypothetical protein ACHBN1_36080 [Heteroscytonema crispum UTEX LB 1556]